MADELFTLKKFNSGSIIYMEKARSVPLFYIVQNGELKETIQVKLFSETIVYRQGDNFGLISCLTGQDYFSRVTALTDCELIIVKKKDIIPFLSSKPDIFLKIITVYSNKLRFLNQKLISLASSNLYQELPEQLLETAGFFEAKNDQSKRLRALQAYQKYARNDETKTKLDSVIQKLLSEGITSPKPQELGSRLIFEPGEIIFLEQEQGDCFYFIEQGRVKISHITKKREFIMALLGEGEFFGEMALLNRMARSATAIAYKETRVLVLSQDNLFSDLKEPILTKIFSSLTRRLWYAYRRVINLSYEKPATRLYDFLEQVIASKEGHPQFDGWNFDFSLDDLKGFTNTTDCKESDLDSFLSDSNIALNYGQIRIQDVTLFRNVWLSAVNHEKEL